MDPNERNDEEEVFENEDEDPFTAADFDYTSEFGDTCE